MKKETPCSSESSTRMLVQSASGGRRRLAAQTGPPAWASTALSPIARSKRALARHVRAGDQQEAAGRAAPPRRSAPLLVGSSG